MEIIITLEEVLSAFTPNPKNVDKITIKDCKGTIRVPDNLQGKESVILTPLSK